MGLFENRKIIVFAGAGLALVAGLGIAVAVMMIDHGSNRPPPASRGGLVVEMGKVDDTPSSNAKPLRCFVGGQFVGMETLAHCAHKNGVSTQALDVGLDANGALTAADQSGFVVTPLPEGIPQPEAPLQVDAPESPSLPVAAPKAVASACSTYEQGEWRKIADGLTATTCAQALFVARCNRPGPMAYGRIGDQSLRSLNGRVEISSDNKSFHVLIEQVCSE